MISGFLKKKKTFVDNTAVLETGKSAINGLKSSCVKSREDSYKHVVTRKHCANVEKPIISAHS